MIRTIIKQMWNQRRQNGWILLLLVLVLFFLWKAIDPVYVLTATQHIADGYDKKGAYILSIDSYSPTHSLYQAEADTNRQVRAVEYERLVNVVRQQPEVEQIADLNYSSYPNSFGMQGMELFRDTLKQGCQWYEFSFAYKGNPFEVLKIRDVRTGEVMKRNLRYPADKSIYLDETLALKLFSKVDVVGEKLYQNKDELVVAGVMQTFKTRSNQQPVGLAVVLTDESQGQQIGIRLKPGVDEKAFEQRFVDEVAPQLRHGNFYFTQLRSLDAIQHQYASMSGTLNVYHQQLCLSVFFLLCTFLGVTGTFWVRCQARRQEIGLQRAMGCSLSNVYKQLFIEALLLVSVAAVVALVWRLNIAVSDGFYKTQLDEASPYWQNHFVAHFVIVSIITYLIVAVMAVFATYFPARQAAHIQPSEALKDE